MSLSYLMFLRLYTWNLGTVFPWCQWRSFSFIQLYFLIPFLIPDTVLYSENKSKQNRHFCCPCGI